MSQLHSDDVNQEQENIAHDNTVYGDFFFSPKQIATYIETQIIQISSDVIEKRKLEELSPYMGLNKFNSGDRDYFFGRDKLIAELLKAVNKSNFSLVLGASGSGKSSLIRAGLLPETKRFLSSQVFCDLVFTPSQNPFESFERSLFSEEKNYPFSQSEAKIALKESLGSMSKVVDKLKKHGDRWLIFIDQFEQLFTIHADLQEKFIAEIVEIANKKDSSVRIVLAMSTNFVDEFSAHSSLIKIAQNNIHLITEISPEGLREAIQQPAAKHGVVFEDGLVDHIINEVKGRRGYLPLLQYTLDLLWKYERNTIGSDNRCHLADRKLNWSSYNTLGGVEGALQKKVDEIYDSICKEYGDGELIIQKIFLKLINVIIFKTEFKVISRPAFIYEFSDELKPIVARFIEEKILVGDSKTLKEVTSKGEIFSIKTKTNLRADATIEIAHDVLINSWKKLKQWIAEEKETILLKAWLADATNRWINIREKDKAKAKEDLLQGSRLEQIILFKNSNYFEKLDGLSEREIEFIDESIKAEKNRASRKKKIFAASVLTSITFALLSVFSLFQWQSSIQNEVSALQQSALASARSSQDLDALLKAIYAFQKSQETIFPTSAHTDLITHEILRETLSQVAEFNRIRFTAPIYSVDFSPNGELIALGGEGREGSIILIINLDGEILGAAKSNQGVLSEVVFSPDGKTIASSGSDGSIKVWNLDVSLVNEAEGDGSSINDFLFSSDGKYIVSGDADGAIQVWNLSSNSMNEFQAHSSAIQSIDLNSQEELIVSASNDGTAKVWHLDGQLSTTLSNSASEYRIEFSPDGSYIASAGESSLIKFWNLNGQLIHSYQHDNGLILDFFGPDGETLTLASENDTIRFWTTDPMIDFGNSLSQYLSSQNDNENTSDINEGKFSALFKAVFSHELVGHSNAVIDVSFSPKGNFLVSTSWDGSVLIWQLKNGILQGTVFSSISSERGVTRSRLDENTSSRTASVRFDRRIRSVGLTATNEELVSLACAWLDNFLTNQNTDLTSEERNVCQKYISNEESNMVRACREAADCYINVQPDGSFQVNKVQNEEPSFSIIQQQF
jgi:WD40 repeat protein/energy-coupling factor transporter ATP-binding protein EcfA2